MISFSSVKRSPFFFEDPIEPIKFEKYDFAQISLICTRFIVNDVMYIKNHNKEH